MDRRGEPWLQLPLAVLNRENLAGTGVRWCLAYEARIAGSGLPVSSSTTWMAIHHHDLNAFPLVLFRCRTLRAECSPLRLRLHPKPLAPCPSSHTSRSYTPKIILPILPALLSLHTLCFTHARRILSLPLESLSNWRCSDSFHPATTSPQVKNLCNA